MSRILVFPPSSMLGVAKYANSFTSIMVTCLESRGWRVENFSYLRSLWSSQTLIINWPEYFGRYGTGRFSGLSITPVVFLLQIAKLLRRRTKVVLVHHNLPGQRFRHTLGTRMLHTIADTNISLGASPRLTSAIRRDTSVISHPAYSILAKSREKKYPILLVSDKSRTDAQLRLEGNLLYWSRDGLISPSMMDRHKRVILGKLCELQLHTLISESKTFVIPWPKVLNSGLGILSIQLGTIPAFVDQEYVREANANGIGVAYWDSNSQTAVNPPEASKCLYSGITDPHEFNQQRFCSPLIKALTLLKHE